MWHNFSDRLWDRFWVQFRCAFWGRFISLSIAQTYFWIQFPGLKMGLGKFDVFRRRCRVSGVEVLAKTVLMFIGKESNLARGLRFLDRQQRERQERLRFTCRGHFNASVFWGKKRVDLWSCASKLFSHQELRFFLLYQHKCFSVKKAGSLAEAISTQVFFSSTSGSCVESRFQALFPC